MISKECEKCIHCRVCAYNNPKKKPHCDFYEESRPTGGWIIIGEEQGPIGITYKIRKCNKCGWTHSLVIPNNFCSNCGADMRKGGAENDT